MTILGLFLLENSLLIIGLGPRHFFTNAFYVLDLVVVVVSLALEVRSLVYLFVRWPRESFDGLPRDAHGSCSLFMLTMLAI
jgi:hypothetical protein